jgi:hypothetical protein
LALGSCRRRLLLDARFFGDQLRGLSLAAPRLRLLALDAFRFGSQLAERARDEVVRRTKPLERDEGGFPASRPEFAARVVHG